MTQQLRLSNIRNVLVRLEETIIFALIERAQFRQNAVVYEPGALHDVIGDMSIAGYLLYETEKIHARMRRYTSPDEHPFFRELPDPILPALRFDENPLHPNNININQRIWDAYGSAIIPLICQGGDDQQYGSTAVCDVMVLQALSKRIHYGKFVAESKFQADSAAYSALIRVGDEGGIMSALTDLQVEQQVLERVGLKARTYCRELSDVSAAGIYKVDPDAVVQVYRDWIMPLTKDVQLQYLLGRLKP